MPQDDLVREGQHLLSVCNACRYCEGFCAVWPAMERRLVFTPGDLNYLANLCHNCSECYYACPYAPPHEYAINPAKTFAKIRAGSYQQYAWPQPLAGAFRNNGVVVSVTVSLMLVFFWSAALAWLGGRQLFTRVPGGNFYRITSHELLISAFLSVSALILIALAVGFFRFWRDSGESPRELRHFSAWIQAMKEAGSLKYLSNGGSGCTYPDEKDSQARRWFHHFTFYGFLLCFASTSVAAVYHSVLGWVAPYSYGSLPVVLGTLGGIGLLIGPAGLWLLMRRRDAATGDDRQYGMDAAFIAMLGLTSLTGLLLMILRETRAMGALLVIHLAVVMALFLTMPYGKFVHWIYRFAALIKYALEQSRDPQVHKSRA